MVLITGTSAGIGLATALHFARMGHDLHAGVRDLETATELTQALAKEKLPIRPVTIDVDDEASVRLGVGETFVLDGEIAVFDQELVSPFRVAPAYQPRRPDHAADVHGFDLLQLEEKDYRPEPLKVRRKALEKLVKRQRLILPALSPNGFAAWTEVVHRGWEG